MSLQVFTAAKTCVVCGRDADCHLDEVRNTSDISCSFCGPYSISSEAAMKLESISSKQDRVNLSGAIRHRIEKSPVIKADDLQNLIAACPDQNQVMDKALAALRYVARNSRPGRAMQVNIDNDPPIGYAEDRDELEYLLNCLLDSGWVKVQSGRHIEEVTVTPAGWGVASRRVVKDPAKAFVAMWFGDEVADAYTEGIKPAVEDDCHYRCVRIDGKEYLGGVVDEILAEIRESRFVVADLTGHRQGVYFEAGFAQGLDIPVIFAVQKDHLKDTHFDTKHLNIIVWDEPLDLRSKLQNRIRATIGLGPLKSE